MITENQYRPKPPLNHFIDIIWIGNSSQLNLESSHYAPLFTEFIFNYGDQFNVEGDHIFSYNNPSTPYLVSGLKTKPFKTKIKGRYHCIGLVLKPFCIGFINRFIGTKLLDELALKLFDYLIEEEKPNFQAADRELFRLFRHYTFDKDLLSFESYLEHKYLKELKIKNFNTSIKLSQKSFISKFKKEYLITPNQYLKLKKVNRSIHILRNSKASSLSEIGLESGFYDQAHFIKSFKQHFGVTPKQFNKKQ